MEKLFQVSMKHLELIDAAFTNLLNTIAKSRKTSFRIKALLRRWCHLTSRWNTRQALIAIEQLVELLC
jgi:hypothetical protein